MRILLCILLCFCVNISSGQDSDKEAVKNTVIMFFEGFHNQDSVAIKRTTSEDIIMQTVGKDDKGVSKVKTSNFKKFLKSIVSIPDTTKFHEKILSYQIKVDGNMANAWTPYQFWINDTLSHCGVNSFQMHKQNGIWKIIYIIDTRRRDDCNLN